MAGFKELLAWKKSYSLALEIYKVTKSYPKDELYGIVSQIRRASVSISANVAEGYEKKYKKEYMRFLYISRGSLGEVETFLLFSKDLQYISQEVYDQLSKLCDEVGRLLRGLIKYLSQN